MAQRSAMKVDSRKKESTKSVEKNEKELRENIEIIISSLKENNYDLHRTSLTSLSELIKCSSSTVFSMPLLLQILIEYSPTLKVYYAKCEKDDIKQITADILSLITTLDQNPETLHWKLLGRKNSDIGFWGSDYVTHLVKDIEKKFKDKKKLDTETIEISKQIVKYEISHHCITQCVDFLIETENVPIVTEFVDNEEAAVSIGHYLRRNAMHSDSSDADTYLRTAFEVYFKLNRKIEALLTGLQIKRNNESLLEKLLKSITQTATQRQVCLILGRLNKFVPQIADKELRKIMMNTNRHRFFLDFARHEKLIDAKTPKELLNSNKKRNRHDFNSEDASLNIFELAFMNAFINCGYSNGTEFVNQTLNNSTNSEKMIAVATLGFLCLWDVNKVEQYFEKFNSLPDSYRKAGAILALCTARTGVISESQPFSLVSTFLNDTNDNVKAATTAGLGISYIGSNRKEVIDALKNVLKDNGNKSSEKEVIGIAGVSLGLVALGSINEDIIKALINTIVELETREDKLETKSVVWLLCLGIGFCCFGKEEQCDSILQLLKQISNKQVKQFVEIIVTSCAYFGTGDVLKVQEFLHICSEDLIHEKSSPKNTSKKKSKSNGSPKAKSVNASVGKKLNGVESKATAVGRKGSNLLMSLISAITAAQRNSHNESSSWKNIAEISSNSLKQAAATIGVATIGIGERVGIKMMRRMFAHQLRFCEQPVQRMAPLSLALAYLSNPDEAVVQLLMKYSMHTAVDVSFNSILALGFVAAGTNNDKISKFLESIFTDRRSRRRSFHIDVMPAAKIAFALVHLGKGALTLSPFAFDKQLVRETSFASILVLIVCCMETNTLFGNLKFLWNFLAPCIQSRALITVDCDLNILPTTVRVGKRVDITGHFGKRRAISGFNTLMTPTTLSDNEKAEPGPQEYEYFSPILEDIVVVNKKLAI